MARQLSLVPPVRRRVGRVERAVDDAIRAAHQADQADKRWRAAETLARQLGACIDEAAGDQQVYAVAQLSARLLSVLQDLYLTPAAQEATADEFGEFLASISAPTGPTGHVPSDVE